MPIQLALMGAAGRMGQRIIALAAADARFRVAAALESPDHPFIGRDAGEAVGVGTLGVAYKSCENCEDEFDVAVDFSSPAGTVAVLNLCTRRNRPLVIGVTGHDAKHEREIESASHHIAVLKSANMSVGVNVLLVMAEHLASTLGENYDVEIVEAHHRHKVDAPSGTALALKDAILRGRKPTPDIVYGRHGMAGQRPSGQIAIHAIRGGDVVGEHEVRFITDGETIALRHNAHSRDTFAHGALAAAAWIVGRPAGRYSMRDVLGLTGSMNPTRRD
jgi:4-hydroxy-tetrahydrodipicolinate reductase